VCTCWVSRRAREGTGSWFGTEEEAGKAVQQGLEGVNVLDGGLYETVLRRRCRRCC